MNKKILCVLSSALLLASCGGNQPTSESSKPLDSSTLETSTAATSEAPSSTPAESSEEKTSEPASSDEEKTSEQSSKEPASTQEESSEESSEPAPKKQINIIMTAATIPPVLSALDSIDKEVETYAWIERGKTYSGIADTSFGNIGFDQTQNASSGIPEDAFAKITAKVEDLLAENPDAHFNFYTTDYKPWSPVRVASDAKLSKDHFTVYMVEDGTATYSHAQSKFFDKYSSAEAANANFESRKTAAYQLFEDAMKDSKAIVDRKLHNGFTEGYYYTFPLATHPNFVHLMQDKTKLAARTAKYDGTIFRKVYGIENNDTGYASNVVYRSISERVAALSEGQKEEYLTLMFGDYRSECDRLLHRTTRDHGEEAVPNKKFIFIGTRMRQSGLGYLPTINFADLSSDYSTVPNAVREVLSTEEDYRLVYDYLNDSTKYESAWKDAGDAAINAIKSGALNNYLAYAYNLKFTYRAYGDEYDILFKGHPAETFDQVNKWDYNVTVDGTKYQYRNYMHALALKFHSDDSEGRFVGILPGGVAAENLAYLGVNTYVGGLSSSTYTGYEKTAPILYVLGSNHKDILSDGAIEQRYLDGELEWNDDGKQIKTVYMNNGNMDKWQKNYYLAKAEEVAEVNPTLASIYREIASSYAERFNTWMDAVAGFEVFERDKADVDETGTLLLQGEDDLAFARTIRKQDLATAFAAVNKEEYSSEAYASIQQANDDAESKINGAVTIMAMELAIKEFNAFVDATPKLSEETSAE